MKEKDFLQKLVQVGQLIVLTHESTKVNIDIKNANKKQLSLYLKELYEHDNILITKKEIKKLIKLIKGE